MLELEDDMMISSSKDQHDGRQARSRDTLASHSPAIIAATRQRPDMSGRLGSLSRRQPTPTQLTYNGSCTTPHVEVKMTFAALTSVEIPWAKLWRLKDRLRSDPVTNGNATLVDSLTLSSIRLTGLVDGEVASGRMLGSWTMQNMTSVIAARTLTRWLRTYQTAR